MSNCLRFEVSDTVGHSNIPVNFYARNPDLCNRKSRPETERSKVMKNVWVYCVVAAILAITGIFILRLRLSEIPDLAIGHSSPPPALGKLRDKVVDYEIDGPGGRLVTLSYLGANGEVRDVSTALPWRISLRTTKLSLPTGVVAQADADLVSCRIVIDGETRDSHVSNGPFAAVNCNVLVS